MVIWLTTPYPSTDYVVGLWMSPMCKVMNIYLMYVLHMGSGPDTLDIHPCKRIFVLWRKMILKHVEFYLFFHKFYLHSFSYLDICLFEKTEIDALKLTSDKDVLTKNLF